MQEKTAVIATPFQKKCIILQGHFNVKVHEWVQMLFEKAFLPQKKDAHPCPLLHAMPK